MSNAHASQYYFGSGTESDNGSAPIVTYNGAATMPDALADPPMMAAAPQPGLNAPIVQDKRRGSS